MTTITLSMRLDFKLLFVHLEMSLMDSTDSRQNDTKIALTLRWSRSLLKCNHLCSQLRSQNTLACKCTRKILQCHCSLHWHHSCALLLYTRLPLQIRCRTKSSKLIYLTFYFLGLGTIRREREREISGYTEKQKHFCYILSRWEIQKWHQVYR